MQATKKAQQIRAILSRMHKMGSLPKTSLKVKSIGLYMNHALAHLSQLCLYWNLEFIHYVMPNLFRHLYRLRS